jgi:Tol biopolymer transport system component
MKHACGIALLLSLAACQSAFEKPNPATAKPVRLEQEEIRDNVLPPSAAEPPWRDLVRHTRFPLPSRATQPGPSADGSLFAYATTEFGPHPQIVVRETFGASPIQITSNSADNLFPRISPDGKLVAYASNRDGNWDLYVSRIDSPASVAQVTFEAADEIAPAWSPDGRKLVCCANEGTGAWRIVIVDIATRMRTVLGGGLYPDWSPDAAQPWICFQSQPREAGGRSGIWVVRPDGTGLREVVGDKTKGWSALTPRFSPGGKWIAYASVRKSMESRIFGIPDEADDVWIIRPDGTFDMRLTDELAAEWWPAWGGDRVFFVTNRDGMQNICSVKVKPLEDDK